MLLRGGRSTSIVCDHGRLHILFMPLEFSLMLSRNRCLGLIINVVAMADGPHRKTIQRSAGYALAGSAFALLVASVGVRLHVDFATVGFLHLLTVVVVAMVAGFWKPP